jgi:hypothetical protein
MVLPPMASMTSPLWLIMRLSTTGVKRIRVRAWADESIQVSAEAAPVLGCRLGGF